MNARPLATSTRKLARNFNVALFPRRVRRKCRREPSGQRDCQYGCWFECDNELTEPLDMCSMTRADGRTGSAESKPMTLMTLSFLNVCKTAASSSIYLFDCVVAPTVSTRARLKVQVAYPTVQHRAICPMQCDSVIDPLGHHTNSAVVDIFRVGPPDLERSGSPRDCT